MKKIASFFAITFLICFLIQTVNSFADEPCYVYINNQPLTFDDATPQIMNNRVMVPFRKTAETLGATVDWNSATETMTLTKASNKVVHTLRSNIIYVNGEAITFDTPSTVLKSRTMMPVRMLAEALNANVDWDSATRRVLIETGETSILSVSPAKNNINNGESVNITVMASSTTERVKLVDSATDNLVSESVVYNQNGEARIFVLQYTPNVSVTETKILKVYGGNSVGYDESEKSVKNCIITVALDNSPKIVNITASDRSVAKNDYVELSIYTNSAADRVRIMNSFKANNSELTNYNLSGDERVFQTKIKMTEKGENDLYIYVGNASGYEPNYETLTIDVGATGSTSKSSDNDELEILDVDFDADIAVGENVTVTVTTTYDVSKVEIYDDSDGRIAKKNFPATSSLNANEKTWEIQFEVKSSGRNRYTVRAYNDDENSTTQKFNLTGERYSSDDLAILSISQKSNDASLNEKVRMTARTTSVVEYIVVKDSYSNEVAKVESGSRSGNAVSWDFNVEVEKESRNTFTVYAYDDKDNVTSKKFTVSLNIADKPEINDYELEEKTVDAGDEINVTVYTNDAVSKIWIEDEDGHKKKTKKNYDDKDDDEFIWEFSFDADDEKGSYSYTIIAENEDGDQDELTFKVKVVD